MNPRVRFEDEADAEYRFAGRWYEERREHLGFEFFDAVDTTIDQIVEMPEAGALVPRIPSGLPVRHRAVTRFRTASSTSQPPQRSESLPSRTIAGSPDTGKGV